MRSLAFLLTVTLLALLGGCATTAGGTPPTAAQKADPWESWNRKVYSFNDTLDEAVVKPVATAYSNVVPQRVRRGITNFFGNISDVWSAFNNFLQGKFSNGAQDMVRFGTNTVFGLGGFLDVATEFGADRQGEDLGQTLGRWGMGPGPYVVWPLLGPSTLRDSFALPFDRSVTPAVAFSDPATQLGVTSVGLINERANLLRASGLLNDIALDKYVFVRDAYLQRCRSLVYDGDPPEEKTPEESTPSDVPVAPAPASQAGS